MLNFFRQIIPQNFFIRRIFSFLKAFLAAFIYNFPAKKIKIIGITGTDGKTTTCEVLFHILKNNGQKVAKISSANFSIMDTTWTNNTKRTTVSPFLMQKFLKECLDQKIEIVIIEVTSHALVQKRIFGIDFDFALLTNISHEHLDYHGSLENLRAAKKLLFTKFLNLEGISILNADEEVTKTWTKELKKVKTFSFQNKNSDFYATNLQDEKNGLSFYIKKQKFQAKLFGHFNSENCLAAIATAKVLQIQDTEIALALNTFPGVLGRLQNLDFGQNFDIFVDFALTPNAFKKVLYSLKKRTLNKLIVVFGAAGDHDKAKRPLIGQIAYDIADNIILTDDEPYSEEPSLIRQEIKKGIFISQEEREVSLQDKHFFEIPDRKEAIQTALQIAQSGDCIIVAGMGSLTSRNIKGQEIPWDDSQIIADIFSSVFPSKKVKHRLAKLKQKLIP